MKSSSRLIISSFLTLTLFVSPFTVFAKSSTPGVKETSKPALPSVDVLTVDTKAEKKSAEYALPYPGMLPDHPLYTFKALRDRILDFLIVDSVRKAEFSILQADKRLGMGLALVEKGNARLAEPVISKGEKYMYQAVYGLLALKNQGKAVPGYLVDRLERSLAKHADVLGTLVAQVSEPEKSGLAGSLDLVGTLVSELPKLK